MFKKKSPIVEAAEKLASELEAIRKLAERLPEGVLIQVQDWDILALGEAMLLDGATTQEINIFMIDTLEEKLTQKPKLVWEYKPVVAVPGADLPRIVDVLEKLVGR